MVAPRPQPHFAIAQYNAAKDTEARTEWNLWQGAVRSTTGWVGLFGATLLVGGLTACGTHRQHAFSAPLSAEEYAQNRDKMVGKVASRLDLNEDQKKRLGVLGDALYAQRMALIGQAKDPRAELKALVAGDTFDATRAPALVSEKTAAINAMSPHIIAALADFYNSLNATQQQKVRDYMDGRGRWFHRG